jgi:hypothetical protein
LTSLHVDPAAPGFGVSLTSPLAGATISGTAVSLAATPTVPAGWTATDVTFTVDGNFITNVVAPFTWTWDPTGSGSGPHLVGATASFTNDSTFDVTVVGAASVVVNRPGPTVSISAPAAGSSATGTITITAAVTPASGDPVNGVEFYVGGHYVDFDATSPYQASWQTVNGPWSQPNGPVDLRAVAYGSEGSAVSAPVTVTVVNGSVGLTAPASGATVAGWTSLAATATPPGGEELERLSFFVDGVGIGSDDLSPYGVEWNSATVPLGSHVLSVRADFSDGSSLTSPTRSISVISAGGVAVPVASIAALSTWYAATSVAVRWSGTPGTSAITSYDVRYRRAAWNGTFGAYTAWLTGTAATGGTFAGSTGSTYCFSARAHDTGQVSAWTAEACTALPLDDRSLSLHGTWGKGLSTAYYRGTYLRSTSHGAYLTRTGVVARRIALLATVCRTCGTAKVYWGSTLIKTVSLYSSTTAYKRLISVALFSSVRTGTLKIVVSSYSKQVVIDGVAIRRVA